jgi:hypothetical protein
MSESVSPSPIIDYFVHEIEPSLPEDGKARMAGYADRIAATTHHGDFRRAWHCADWAIRVAEASPGSTHGHLVTGLKERHTLWKDMIFGAEFGMRRVDGVGPGQDAEIQWVDDAVAVAKAEADRSGWEAVPWEELLDQMLAVGAPKS